MVSETVPPGEADQLKEEGRKTMKEGNFDKEYCVGCPLRIEKFAGTKPDNKGPNCPAGRRSNPMSIKSTVNTLRAGGDVCSFNPARMVLGLGVLRKMA